MPRQALGPDPMLASVVADRPPEERLSSPECSPPRLSVATPELHVVAHALECPPQQPRKARPKRQVEPEERVGALKAVEGKPSFNCATARRPVEKAICASPELANLDRDVYGSYARALQEAQSPRQARDLRRAQDVFIARRNVQFGKPGYDLQKAMRERLQRINGVDGY